MLVRHCDRCHKELSFADESVRDFLDREYPGQDICTECDLEITLASSFAALDAKNRDKPGTTLRKMCEMYGINVVD